jgi:hypothetical protein
MEMKMTMKTLLLAATTAIVLVNSAFADTLTYSKGAIEVVIKKGAFNQDDRRAEQMLTVINNSAMTVKSIRVECGFFHGDLLIGKDSGYASDVLPGQSAYVHMSAYVLSTDRTDCRIESAHQ